MNKLSANIMPIILTVILVCIVSITAYLLINNTDESDIENNSTQSDEIIEPKNTQENKTNREEVEPSISNFQECIDAGYVLTVSIDGRSFCETSDGREFYQ